MFKVFSFDNLTEQCLNVASVTLDTAGVIVGAVNKLSPAKSTSTIASVATVTTVTTVASVASVSSCSSLASYNGAINTPTDEDYEFCDMTLKEYKESLKESDEEIDDNYDFVLASECKTESPELEMATICRTSS